MFQFPGIRFGSYRGDVIGERRAQGVETGSRETVLSSMCKTVFVFLPVLASASLSKTVSGFASARELHVRDKGEPTLYPPSLVFVIVCSRQVCGMVNYCTAGKQLTQEGIYPCLLSNCLATVGFMLRTPAKEVWTDLICLLKSLH